MARFGGGGMAVFENTLALADDDKREISLYDLTTGEKTDARAFDALDNSTYVGLDKDGPLLGDATGIYRWENGGWKMVVDGGLTSLVMPTLTIEGLFGDGAGAYYAFLSGDTFAGDGAQLLRFRFDESLPAEPSATLNVFSLNDSETVRMAVGAFQRKNPSVRVNLEVGLEEGGAATTEDVVRALNTRLIAGKGPDVLILDGLPIQSYIEKGVLKDITELAGKQSGLMQNLTSAYAKDGKIYGLPALFALPAMVGEKQALAKLTSLDALLNAVRETARPGSVPALSAPDALYDENTGMLMDYYETCAGGFTNAGGSLNEAALAKYLSDMLALSDILKESAPEAGDESMMIGISNGRRLASMNPRAIMEVAQGDASACVQQFSSMVSLLVVSSYMDSYRGETEGMELVSLFWQHQFTPRCGAGVVSAGKQQELAEKFVALLLSSEVQDGNLFDGFPVNRASLQGTLDKLKKNGGKLDDTGFLALCDSLTTPLFTDETVKAAVTAQMKSLLDGSMTPEQAAAKIVADTRLYLAE
jgi:ABC-type glycerol-3-phosphate transport system substrate-binding protein